MRRVGSRLRHHRKELGQSQASLARTVGISPSYLNLIEHDRRPVGGALLARIADALGVDISVLRDDVDPVLIAELRRIAAEAHEGSADLAAKAEDFAAAWPGWAALVGKIHRKTASLGARVTELEDRMTHDPVLSASVHDLLSAVTSIQSTSAILADGPLDTAWRDRFHRNLNEDATRLAQSSQSLARYLANPTDHARDPSTPWDAAQTWLARRNFRPADAHGSIEPDLTDLRDEAARAMVCAFVSRQSADLDAISSAALRASVARHGPDPFALAVETGVSPIVAMRRLAWASVDITGGELGLVGVDGSGSHLYCKPVDGLGLSQTGGTCPLLPVYQAVLSPNRPLREIVVQDDDMPRRFVAFAMATTWPLDGLTGPVRCEAVMLLLPADLAHRTDTDLPLRTVGPGCRLCVATACPARRVPSAVVLR